MDAISGDVGTNVGSIGVNAVSRSVIVDLGSCGGVTWPSGAEWVPKGVTHGPTLPQVSYSRCRIFKRPLPDSRATFYGTDPMGSMGSNRSAVSSQSTELNGTYPMGSIGSNRSVGYGPNVEEGLPEMGSMHALFAEADSDGCIGDGVLASPVSGRLPALFLPSICVAMGITASPTLAMARTWVPDSDSSSMPAPTPTAGSLVLLLSSADAFVQFRSVIGSRA